MTDFDQAVGRSNPTSSGLIPTEYAKQIVKEATLASVCLSKMTKKPDMPTSVRSIPVLNTKPTAYFTGSEAVDGTSSSYDEGLLKTTKAEWGNVSITAEELGVIVPVPKAVLMDMKSHGYDFWGEIKPEIVEAIAVAIDAAILHGTNKPTSWPAGIVTDATSKSHTVALGTGTDMYDDLLAESGVWSLVEDDGYNINGWMADVSLKSRLRGLRTTDGIPLFTSPIQGQTAYTLDGIEGFFPANGALNPASALLIAGDWSKGVYAWRQDMEFDISDSATITDNSGNTVYNLWQQNMIAMKVTCRLGWARPNPVNRIEGTAGSRYPWAVLTPAQG